MGAPKGNKFALFNNGGRPRKYDNPEDMMEVIDEYFTSYIPGENGEVSPALGYKPTVCGLALYLGFASRQSLYDYRDDHKEFTCIIKKALSFIEMNYEQLLESKACTGAIFALKNMGWKDNRDITTDGEKITNNEMKVVYVDSTKK